MYGYIYETTNLINGKKYIGKHKSNKFDKNYFGSGVGLKRSLNKYGKDNFKVVILEEIETNQKDLDLKEMYYIEKYNAVKNKNYYNNSYGGENEGWSGVNKALDIKGRPWTKTKSFKTKLRNLHLGTESPFKGRKHTKESIEKNRKAHIGIISSFKGKHHTEETKKLLSEKCSGYKHTEEARKKMREFRKTYNSYMTGKHHSEESKLKISIDHIGRKWFNDGVREYYIFPDKAKSSYYLGRLKRRIG